MSSTSLNLFLHIINFLTMTNFSCTFNFLQNSFDVLIQLFSLPLLHNKSSESDVIQNFLDGQLEQVFSYKNTCKKNWFLLQMNERAMKAEIIIIENCFLYAQLLATNERKMWSSEDEGENEWARDFPFVCTSLIGIAIFASLMVHKLSYFFSRFRWRSLHVMHSLYIAHTYGCIMNIAERQKITQSFM